MTTFEILMKKNGHFDLQKRKMALTLVTMIKL